MNVILLFFLAQAVCLAAGFGVTYSVLKRTPDRDLSPLVAPILFPALFVVFITFAGYNAVRSIPPLLPAVIIILFTAYSGFVLYRERVALRSARRAVLVSVPVLVASTVLAVTTLAPDIAHRSLTYIDVYSNLELLNYSAVATYLMGRSVNGAYAKAYELFTTTRTGADVLLASVANCGNAPPANCLSLLIALLRAQTIAAFGVLLIRASKWKIAERSWILYAGLALFSLSSLELVNFTISFLSSYAVAPVIILLTALLLFREDVENPFVLGLLSLLNLYIFISYAESIAVPLLIQTVQATIIAFRARSVRLWLLGLSPPVIAALVNPMMLSRRIYFLYALRNLQFGFAIFQPPSESPLAYFSTLAGLRFPYLTLALISDTNAETVAVYVILGCTLVGCLYAFWVYRQFWILAGVLAFIAATAITWATDTRVSGIAPIYKAEKLLIYTHFCLIAGFVLALLPDGKRRVLRTAIIVGFLVALISGLRLDVDIAARYASWAKVYPLSEVVPAVDAIRGKGDVDLPVGDAIASMYWNQVLQYYGVAQRHGDPSTQKQARNLYDYAAAGESRLYEPVGHGQKGAIVAATVAHVSGTHTTAAVKPIVRSATLLQKGTAFNLYSGPLEQQLDLLQVTCDVVFPSPPASPDPILTGGEPLNGSFIYVTYVSPTEGKIAYNLWGTPSVFGKTFRIQTGRVQHIKIVAGVRKGLLQVFLDGEEVLHRDGVLPASHLASFTIGENNIGGGLTGQRFSGQIGNVTTEERP